MKKLPSTLPNMLLSLGIVSVGAGAILGAMYQITKDPIERQAREAQIAAIREVAPPFDNDPEAQADTVTVGDNVCIVYPAREGGRLVGAAVKGRTMEGFGGEIVLMVGFTADGTVRDYRVLQQAETPGLGTKMETWFRDPTGARSVINRNPATSNFTVSKDGGDIDAITAATISSRAFLGVMRDAYEAYRSISDAEGGDVKDSARGHDASSGASRRKTEIQQ